VIDREILEHIAKDKKLGEKTIAFLNEQYPDLIVEYLSWIVGEKAFAKSESINALFRTIISFATLEPCIFVGRGAYLLLPREKILAVRFIASDEYRIKRLAKLLNMTEKEAANSLAQADKEQRLFFKQVYGKKTITPDEFDMVINFDYIRKPKWAAEIVNQAFKEKFRKVIVD
jgi:cytidylate kinase